ncbi:unnamed protein product [Mycena citricolor]|uniref:Major facilitator superfamily (MFS) profile domain-containing protein n=1 Tax=Mycena citricolor TaxID=2018698 RepID=A0AAD2HG11_9AGAR|nr:unnamed protein product [Mycena citricolor]
MTSVTTNILLPLTADLAPPNRRGTALSIVISGLLLGVLIARVLAGIFGQYATWRATYYFAVGVQACALGLCWLIIPDCPPPSGQQQLSYLGILCSMGKLGATEPALIQGCCVNFGTSVAFTGFWVTLTFLLGGPAFRYSTLDIGLFGLIGIVAVMAAPLTGRLIDAFVPWHATLLSVACLCLFFVIQTLAEGRSIAAVVIIAFGLGLFRQIVQASVLTQILSIAPESRSRMNALSTLSVCVGQVFGTAAGTAVFLRYGWRMAGLLSVALCLWQILILLLRGPHCERYTWFGWQDGLGILKRRMV